MYKYTVEGLAEAEQADSSQPAASTSSDFNPAVPHSKDHYQYQLKGVVVHSGTAFAGHYYSYIKVGMLLQGFWFFTHFCGQEAC